LIGCGQRLRNSGGEKNVLHPWITAGCPGISSMLTRPFNRSSRAPQCSASFDSRVSASAGESGRVQHEGLDAIGVCCANGLCTG
jgi:hypothetical protein